MLMPDQKLYVCTVPVSPSLKLGGERAEYSENRLFFATDK